MAETPSHVTCQLCHARIKVNPKLLGRTVKCPNCDGSLAMPPPPAEVRLRVTCPHCDKVATLPDSKLGKVVVCKGCEARFEANAGNARRVKVKPKAKAAKKKKPEEPPPDTEVRSREAFNAWKVMQQAKQDSYWVAQWRAVLYPYQALGVLIFFVVGVPVALAATEALGKAGLLWAGDALETPEKKAYFAAGVVAMGMAVILASLSFFCSFLFGVVRVGAEGRSAVPVIQGMFHRANLASVGAWAAVHFGPGLFLGFWLGSKEGVFFVWTPPAILLLAVLGLIAPMNFLRSAVVSAVAGLDPVGAVKGIAAVGKEYAYFLLVLIVSGALFLLLGTWASGRAAAALAGAEPSYGAGIGFRILSGLLFMMPAVVFARGLGLLLRYAGDALPFDWDTGEAESKGQMLPQLLLLAAAGLLFVPFHGAAKAWTERGGVTAEARRNLEIIFDALRVGTDRTDHPSSYEDLAKKVGSHIQCPALPDRDPDYGFLPLTTASPGKWVWIYELAPTDPDGKYVHVLQHTGTIRAITPGRLEKILAIQEKWEKAIPEQKDAIEKEQIAAWGL